MVQNEGCDLRMSSVYVHVTTAMGSMDNEDMIRAYVHWWEGCFCAYIILINLYVDCWHHGVPYVLTLIHARNS